MIVSSGSSRTRLMATVGGMSLLLASLADAAPAISGMSGGGSNGTTVTITGSGFGAGDATPLLWDDFDDPSMSTGAAISKTPRRGSWVTFDGTTYSSAQKISGNRSLRAAFNSGVQWSNFYVTMPNDTKFYQSFWFRYDGSGTQGQVKLALVHGNSGQGEFAPTINNNSSTTSWWMTNIATESAAGQNAASWPGAPDNNTWHQFEMALKQSSGGGAADGSVTVWVDGQQMYSKTNIVTRNNAQYYWNEMGFLHGVTNMGTNTDTYIDDAYANNSWTRVVLCDSATFSACKRKEIQPVQNWADGSITFTLASSSFSNPSNTYLYVVDANGTANANGFRLCSTCVAKIPTAPVLQSVN